MITVDDIVISMRRPTLRGILKCVGVYRRKNESDPLEVASKVQITGSPPPPETNLSRYNVKHFML